MIQFLLIKLFTKVEVNIDAYLFIFDNIPTNGGKF